MFSKNDMKISIFIIWIVSFIILWTILGLVLPKNEFKLQLDQIEMNVANKDWYKAKNSMKELKTTFDKNKVIIQMNNSTETFCNFQSILGQLDSSISHEQESSLEYIGALRASVDFVIKGFSGP